MPENFDPRLQVRSRDVAAREPRSSPVVKDQPPYRGQFLHEPSRYLPLEQDLDLSAPRGSSGDVDRTFAQQVSTSRINSEVLAYRGSGMFTAHILRRGRPEAQYGRSIDSGDG